MNKNHKLKNCHFGTVKVGERGQVVIPQELRDELGIKAGDKLVALSKHGKGLLLVKSEEVGKMLVHMTEKMDNLKNTIKNVKE